MSDKLGLFEGEKQPTALTAWKYFEKGKDFNNAVNLEDTVRVNENFYIGRVLPM